MKDYVHIFPPATTGSVASERLAPVLRCFHRVSSNDGNAPRARLSGNGVVTWHFKNCSRLLIAPSSSAAKFYLAGLIPNWTGDDWCEQSRKWWWHLTPFTTGSGVMLACSCLTNAAVNLTASTCCSLSQLAELKSWLSTGWTITCFLKRYVLAKLFFSHILFLSTSSCKGHGSMWLDETKQRTAEIKLIQGTLGRQWMLKITTLELKFGKKKHQQGLCQIKVKIKIEWKKCALLHKVSVLLTIITWRRTHCFCTMYFDKQHWGRLGA